jgi:hypothetical protein
VILPLGLLHRWQAARGDQFCHFLAPSGPLAARRRTGGAGQACRHRPGIGRDAALEAAAEIAMRPITFRRVGAHHQPVADRLASEAEREVDRLAQADDQVRFCQGPEKIAERGVFQAARAFHRHDRRSHGVGQAREDLARPGRVQRWAGQDQWSLRRIERRPDRRDVALGRGHRLGPQAHLRRKCFGRLRLEHVERERQMHGPRTPGERGAQRARRVAPQRGRRGGAKRQLGHGGRHLGLRQLLEGAPAVLRDRRGAGEQQHGALG